MLTPTFGPEGYDALSAWIGVTLYSTQIYCDFSRYSDMAIACAALLGYRLSVNVLFPYFAHSLQEFWRRWHIRLSTWLRDYLYISLGGNRVEARATYVNVMMTMILGGLWTGQLGRLLSCVIANVVGHVPSGTYMAKSRPLTAEFRQWPCRQQQHESYEHVRPGSGGILSD
ncbi:MAG: hypothetical protein ACI9W2_001390 [Gammaproteobacteria bacterium]|jgi:hypothetical protein